MKLPNYLICCILGLSLHGYAQAAFKGDDLSGEYSCIGKDSSEGSYKGTVRMKLKPEQSSGKYSAYDFELEVPGYGKYPGHAAGNGHKLAIYFAHVDAAKNQDFGIGIANFKRNSQDKWTFRKFYYQPKFKGGNHGLENCTQK
jgi:hypothetical protein